jgi:hypothetical protein
VSHQQQLHLAGSNRSQQLQQQSRQQQQQLQQQQQWQQLPAKMAQQDLHQHVQPLQCL